MYRYSSQPGLAALLLGILALSPAPAAAASLTLDQAIDRLARENLVLRAQQLEIAQAEADVTAAWHRSPTLLFISNRNAGPDGYRIESVQVIPKRWARALVARRAKEVLEAQYQDSLRLQTQNLQTAYVDLQAAQVRVQFAKTYFRSIENIFKTTKLRHDQGQAIRADVDRSAATRERAAITLAESETALAKTRMTLANLLGIPAAEAATIEVQELPDPNQENAPPPPVEDLIELALQHRPDLHSYRLGLRRAGADMIVAWFDQFPDFSVQSTLDQPRANPAGGVGNAALPVSGLWVSFPDAALTRGKLARTRINVAQSRLEFANAEQNVILDVRLAHLEFQQSLAVQRQYKDTIVPTVRLVRDDTQRLHQGGEVSLEGYFKAQQEYNDAVVAYRDALIRHRRSMLELNTAVGKRIFP